MTKMVSHRRALSLFREQERLSRSIGSIDGQLTSLGNQAEALVNLGQPDKAMALLRKKEKLCHKQKVPHQLVRALFAQGEILVQNPTHRPEVLRVLEETGRLSKEHGYTKLSQRVERFRNKLH